MAIEQLSAIGVMRDAPVIPVIVLHDVATAVPLARAEWSRITQLAAQALALPRTAS